MSVPLYIDHHVKAAITDGLRDRGVDVITCAEDGTAQLDDDQVLARAAELGRAVFTQDDDFLAVADAWLENQLDFAGVILRSSVGSYHWPSHSRSGADRQSARTSESTEPNRVLALLVIARRSAGVGTKETEARNKHAAYPVERPVSAGDMVVTIYQLIGVNPALTVRDLIDRPVPISHGGEPVWEVIS